MERCPCCYKKTEIVYGILLNQRPIRWDNFMSRAAAEMHAKRGVCPWCGRETTIVARVLLRRFEPTLRSFVELGVV